MKLINISFGNIVFANRVIAMVSPELALVKKLYKSQEKKVI